MTDFFTSQPMKYGAFPAGTSPESKRLKLEQMIMSGDYLWSQKFDGNWSRAIISDEHAVLQTRGISKKTGNYGEVQDKVFFWDEVVKAFDRGTTVILGEIYLPGGIDRDCGSILRCLSDKALVRQKNTKLEWRVFDVLALDGEELINSPVSERVAKIPEVVARINSPLVKGIEYHEMDETFFDKLTDILASGGEGAVCYRKDAIYIPGKRGPHAWESLKVKQEITADVDCFICGIEPAVKAYTGKDLGHWTYWLNTRTGEKLIGEYFGEYQTGASYEPISKGYYYGWPGAIIVGVYDKSHNIVPLCKVAGLTEEFKTQLRDNFEEWKMCPVSIGGMMVSQTDSATPSIRHPYLKSIRLNDISPEDCTLEKILS